VLEIKCVFCCSQKQEHTVNFPFVGEKLLQESTVCLQLQRWRRIKSNVNL